jgi:hypothetical protein
MDLLASITPDNQNKIVQKRAKDIMSHSTGDNVLLKKTVIQDWLRNGNRG